MIKRYSNYFIIIMAFIALMYGCERFDRSKIKMPEFNFATTENLHGVAFIDNQHIWVSGSYGTILFSSDGGKTWEKQESGIKELLLGCITFVNRSKGWAAGVGGTIVHTTDGGKNWTAQKSGSEYDIHDIFFLNTQKGWAVGEYGTVLHTDDGGKQWKQQKEHSDVFYNDVFFADSNTGWIVGEFGTILHTEDGGATWQPQECRDLETAEEDLYWDKPLPALYGACFLDSSRGWIVGLDGVIIKTVDGGKTWTRLNSTTDKPLYSILIKGQKGWIIGNKGAYLMSSDGGETWTSEMDAIKTKFWLRELSFVDEKHGLIVGARGTIARSDDGGKSWDLISGYRYDMEEFGLADF